MTISSRTLGELLLRSGAVGAPELERALELQRGSGRRLGELLKDEGQIDGETLARALADQLGLEYCSGPLTPIEEASAVVDGSIARRRQVVPVTQGPRTVTLAMSDPLDITAVDDVRFQTGRRVEIVVASEESVEAALEVAYGGTITTLIAELPFGGDPSEDPEALERAARAAPVVRLVDHILASAANERASDIHFEAHERAVDVRYRVDGLLRRVFELPPHAGRPIVSRLKVMAGMDIAIRRKPQDGRFSQNTSVGPTMMRVSTVPLPVGEKAVVRLLASRSAPETLDHVGLAPNDLAKVRALVTSGQGVILAAGPTGSGKSSTLQAALSEIDRETMNVVTLEDPVEYRIQGATQVQMDPRAGLTFPTALRAVLRQDPDVIMVGEIRDRETAEIAMKAAITGHLVLSTIHTADAPGAVIRLLEMGVPPYLVSAGLIGVIAQRLVRTVCTLCGGRRSNGCGSCHLGYSGRTGVFQVLTIEEEVRGAISLQVAGLSEEIRRLARQGGMSSMTDDARRKVAEGLTTPHEVARVLRGDTSAETRCRSCREPVPVGARGCPSCGLETRPHCRCGQPLRAGWRYCPKCLAPVQSA